MGRIETRGDGADKPRRRKAARFPDDVAARLAAATVESDNAGMEIMLNGEPRQIAAATNVVQLLQLEGLAERRVAVEVNGEIVPRSRHGERSLVEGDRIEIVHALGGG